MLLSAAEQQQQLVECRGHFGCVYERRSQCGTHGENTDGTQWNVSYQHAVVVVSSRLPTLLLVVLSDSEHPVYM